MSYQLKIDRRSSNAGRFISRTHRELQNAFSESGLKQYQLAEKLNCNKSHVNRVLTGKENLTLRTIADFAWALGYFPKLELLKKDPPTGANISSLTHTLDINMHADTEVNSASLKTKTHLVNKNSNYNFEFTDV